MSTKPRPDRLAADVTRSMNEVARQIEKMEQMDISEQAREGAARPTTPIPLKSLRAESAAHELPAARRIPTPPPSFLINPRVRPLIQEEARLHWHHRELPVSRFSACLLA